MLSFKLCKKASVTFMVLLFAAGLLIGGLAVFFITFEKTNSLSNQVADLQNQVSALTGSQNVTYQNITIYQNGTSLADIYSNVRDSVVLVQGTESDGTGVQGSGFVYRYANRNVVITNYHVVHGTADLSITFSNGHGYAAVVLGTDAYVDLAILSVNDAPASEFKPVEIVSSSTLRVGDPVIAIGNPYGLVGSLTTGVVSALGRTITEDYAGGFSIANIIQTSAPINPGNSGGPLLNAVGNVVGITTAIVSDSQGLGFAIPSNTILREIASLITTGTYKGHSYLGVSGQDMSYYVAQQIGASVSYGWRIATVASGGPSDGRLRVGDIIIALNGTTIRNNDDLASYLEEKTLPGQTLAITVVRGGVNTPVNVVLGTRPPPPT
ncbi:MAG: trypsin-like peptidase domain-containing protein [Candidatus Bathyarchaeota archaeon]|nr:trypsin-like peptidase domain-containing protein [Candidatus Bathyarchaeota archaeon]